MFELGHTPADVQDMTEGSGGGEQGASPVKRPVL